jgi:hypothetical protein
MQVLWKRNRVFETEEVLKKNWRRCRLSSIGIDNGPDGSQLNSQVEKDKLQVVAPT